MRNEKLFKGYDEKFISNQTVPLPNLSSDLNDDLASDNEGNRVIRYINYSLQQSESHKFPFYTAANIDGLQFKKVPRKDNWRKDTRISKDFQFGRELYNVAKSDFDRGHMTKREDVQWGETLEIALNASNSTFYYTNAVPQHKNLNRVIWRSLEDYILHTEAKKNELRICVFTGPVLSSSNPYFVTPINGKQIRIPYLFWKVVVFQKEDGNLYRVGFMMSQKKLLQKNHIIEELESDDHLFMEFNDADTYQVSIPLIEEITGLELPKAIDLYADTRNTKLVLEQINIDLELENYYLDNNIGFTIKNITL